MASPGKEAAVTKESKLALIIGFVLVLVVGVLVSDHFSQANNMSYDTIAPGPQETQTPIATLNERESRAIDQAFARNDPAPSIQQPQTRQPQTESFTPYAIDNTNPGSILDNAIDYARNADLPEAASTIKRRDEPTSPVRTLPEREYKAYTVQSGDTLIGIARRYLGDGERYKDIEAINADKLGPDLILKIGMTLKLPSDASTDARSTRQITSTPSSSSERTYTIKTGDTLGEIAYKLLGTSKRMDEIVELNGLDSPDTIYVGMTLRIPAK